MEHDKREDGLLRRGLLRLLDGKRPWGSIEIRPDRYGVTRYRLVVYPPGISETERRWVRLWRGWPLWGAALFIASEITVSETTEPWFALAVSLAAYLGTGAVTAVGAGDVRGSVRTMAVMVMAGDHDPASRAACDRLQTLAAAMVDADDQRREGLISPIDYEMVWWRVYDQLTPPAAQSAVRRA
jgi:hypothetical protein